MVCNQGKFDKTIIYQIYPISFFDANGDGYGDLNGITEKLWYIKELGANALWINPIFTSPFKDAGYDVTDYTEINPRLGTKDDYKKLLDTAHKMGMKVLMDFVPGHTSVQHKWFIESRKREKNKYSNYYVWTDSVFEKEKDMLAGESERDGCVLTNYYSSQVALNYGYAHADKPWKFKYDDAALAPLREEIIGILKYWMGFGVDGFRMDLSPSIVKQCFETEPLMWVWHKIIGGVKSEFPEAIFMAEWGNPSVSVGKCGFDLDYMTHENEWYNQLIRCERGQNILPSLEGGSNYFSADGKGSIKLFVEKSKDIIKDIQAKGCFVLSTGYHDVPRYSFGSSVNQLKLYNALMMTYKTVPMIYYGDEIGMAYNADVMKDGGYTRTGSRTPMQWTDGKNRGFSTADEIYLPTGLEKGVSVESQLYDENSLLTFTKELIKIRNEYDALGYDAELNIIEDDYPFIFERSVDGQTIIVMINPSGKTVERTAEFSKVIKAFNCTVSGTKIRLNAESLAILQK